MSTDSTVIGDELMSAVSELRRLVRREVRTRVDDSPASSTAQPPLRGAQVELLRAVEQRSGIGVAAVATELRLAANSVSTLVNQLVSAGMLIREPDPFDRRAVRLRATDAAQRRLASWRAARTELVADGVRRLPAGQRQALAGAVPALRALMAAIEEGQG